MYECSIEEIFDIRKKFPEMETALRHFKGSNSGPATPFNYCTQVP